MKKTFTFFSRLMAVLCTAMLLQPVYASQNDGLYFNFTGCNVDYSNYTPAVTIQVGQTPTLPTVVNTFERTLFFVMDDSNSANDVGSINSSTGEITLSGQTGFANITVMDRDNSSIYDEYDLFVVNEIEPIAIEIPDNLPEEVVVTDLGTFNVGQMITDHALWNKKFHSRPEPYNNHRVQTMGNLPPSKDVKTGIEEWRLDTICCVGFRDAEINAIEYVFNEDSTAIVKKINHSIKLTIERENYVEAGPFYNYGEVPDGVVPDPTIVHDTTIVYDGTYLEFAMWFMFYYVSECYVTYDENLERNIFYREWTPIHTQEEHEHYLSSSNSDMAYIDPEWSNYSRYFYVNGIGETTITDSCLVENEKHMAKSVSFKIITEQEKMPANVIVSTVWGGDAVGLIRLIMDPKGIVLNNESLWARAENDWGFVLSRWNEDTWQTDWTVSSSNENVATVEKTEYGFWLNPVAHGMSEISITWKGDSEYKASSTHFDLYIEQGKYPNEPRALRDASGNPITEYFLTEGTPVPEPELYNPEKPNAIALGYAEFSAAQKHVVWYFNQDGSLNTDIQPIAAGEDTLLVAYSRYNDGPFDTIRVPMHIEPRIAPVSTVRSTSFDFGKAALGEEEGLIFSQDVNNAYNTESRKFEIKDYIYPSQVKYAMDSLWAGSIEWVNTLPGTIAFNLAPGKGRITAHVEVEYGYEFHYAFRSICKTFNIQMTTNPADPNEYWIDYDNNEIGVLLLYVEVKVMNAPARNIPAAKKDGPIALFSSVTVAPEYAIDAKQDPDNTDYYYSTFYHDQKYALPGDGTEAYVATINGAGDLEMKKVAGNSDVLPINTGLILKSSTGKFDLTPSDGTPVTVSVLNELLGVNEATAAPSNCYVLSGRSTDGAVQGVGFYQFSGTIPAHKAYITYSGNQAPKRMRFIFDNENTATGVDNTKTQEIATKLIKDGHLYIIKDNVYYNAQGQIVK